MHIDPEQVHEGMLVFDAQGRRLGHVAAVGDTHFEMERGYLSARDYLIPYARVERVQGRDLMLAAGPLDLTPEDDDVGGALPPHGQSDFSGEPNNL
ncbi:DUF2171 domain-containing protein [Aggregicoccus sp. 17bor-14]|uniref:DUF2171 domain-containing protein n=1 Tax=Myxococcaceae TaxID=31 RepID=UPI00129D041F|nr:MULTISPECIES: DUF2171 domain-containing protein [Myxococcaceae]MBF5045942.1 DUF2171 domain-containing protein [Simulacricoccus sp. 17bor-14]MRI91674.1 DUF2171 domain-containing protein [Aggregicoccus sp. 17bor-14]